MSSKETECIPELAKHPFHKPHKQFTKPPDQCVCKHCPAICLHPGRCRHKKWWEKDCHNRYENPDADNLFHRGICIPDQYILRNGNQCNCKIQKYIIRNPVKCIAGNPCLSSPVSGCCNQKSSHNNHTDQRYTKQPGCRLHDWSAIVKHDRLCIHIFRCQIRFYISV